MKNALVIISLIVVASTLSLGAVSCGSNSDTGQIATISSIEVDQYDIQIDLKPTSAVQANHQYTIQVYEANYSGVRYECKKSWSQADLNVQATETVIFDDDYEEYTAYMGASQSALLKVFTVKVLE